jgi:alpha-beta hydrolase superfamily lysophospholipase
MTARVLPAFIAIAGLLLVACSYTGRVPRYSLHQAAPTSLADRADLALSRRNPLTWEPDSLLPGFWAATIDLGRDYDGPVTATLVRRPLQRQRDCAVLYIHGYVDYFFQTHLADYYEGAPAPATTRTGCDFFALDLRKYGRSLPAGYRYPNFVKSLDEYFREISDALSLIRAEGYPFVLLNGHSTGALIAVRYLQSGRLPHVVDALFLNSPFLDFNDRDLAEDYVPFAKAVGLAMPHARMPSPVPVWYVRSLLRESDECRECRGRWDFDPRLKPVEGFPVFFGWVRAIAKAQERAREGGIRQPILILHSSASDDGADSVWHAEYGRADLVLDVQDMVREGPSLGRQVTIAAIEGGVHDLSLSDADARAQFFAELSAWLRTVS